LLLRQIDDPKAPLAQDSQELIAADVAAELLERLARIQGPRGILVFLPDVLIIPAHKNSPTIFPCAAAILPQESSSGHIERPNQSREIL